MLSTAREALDEAYRYISDMYSPILTECARQPLKQITDGRYDSVMLDRGFNLRVKSGGTMHELVIFARHGGRSLFCNAHSGKRSDFRQAKSPAYYGRSVLVV